MIRYCKKLFLVFMVKEVYVRDNAEWEMDSLTFSRLMRPVKLNAPENNSLAH